MTQSEVLIIGAGPTGLVLALWLAKQGVSVRIIDKAADSGTTSRALAVQARTLELYRQLDLAEAIVEHGYVTPAVNFWVKGARAARIAFDTTGADLTPYAFLQIFPQDRHERLLIERLAAIGVGVERPKELAGFRDEGGHVVATLRGPDGREETCEAHYIAGCDGARSVVRQGIGTGFPGGTYRQLFYVADVEGGGPAFNGELNVALDSADFLAVFPLSRRGRARLIGTVRGERAEDPASLGFEDVSRQAIDALKVVVDKVNWFSTYHVHHRVTEHFRRGRAFVLGDAAHVHSPAGGQGMNTGIGDAINLAWKLAAVLGGRAPDSLLDSFEVERIDFARRLVATTDRIFSVASAEGPIADLLRTRIAPILLPAAASLDMARDYLFRTVSQITLNYRGSRLSQGAAGHVHGGDRLPWVRTDGGDNFAPLADIVWQAHVYGAAGPDLSAWCAARGLALHAFAWRPQFADVGLARDALYLVRPDTYVALADVGGSPDALDRYFAEQRISLAAV